MPVPTDFKIAVRGDNSITTLLPVSTRTGAQSLVDADVGTMLQFTAAGSLDLGAATVSDGFFVVIENAGTGEVTLSTPMGTTLSGRSKLLGGDSAILVSNGTDAWINLPLGGNWDKASPIDIPDTTTLNGDNLGRLNLLADVTGKTATLPAMTSTIPNGATVFLHNTSGTHDWTVAPNTGDTIDGASASITLKSNDSVILVGDFGGPNTDWYSLSGIGGVRKIIEGTGIDISPSSGVGDVTIEVDGTVATNVVAGAGLIGGGTPTSGMVTLAIDDDVVVTNVAAGSGLTGGGSPTSGMVTLGIDGAVVVTNVTVGSGLTGGGTPTSGMVSIGLDDTAVVRKISEGTGIDISPAAGTGDVEISAAFTAGTGITFTDTAGNITVDVDNASVVRNITAATGLTGTFLGSSGTFTMSADLTAGSGVTIAENVPGVDDGLTVSLDNTSVVRNITAATGLTGTFLGSSGTFTLSTDITAGSGVTVTDAPGTGEVSIGLDNATVVRSLTAGDGVSVTNGGVGDVTVSTASPQGAAAPNLLINGDFNIWQRGGNFTLTGYTADRWRVEQSSGSFTVSRGSFTLPEVDNFTGSATYYLKYAKGTAAGTLEQRVENVRTLAGETATLTLWARLSSGSSLDITPQITQNFGSSGTTPVTTGTAMVTVGTTWEAHSVTIDVPEFSTAAATGGADDYVAAVFSLPATTGATTLEVAQVKLEAGDTATEFVSRPAGEELALCQRYFYVASQGVGVCSSPVQAYMHVEHKQEMRTTPAFSTSAPIQIHDTTGSYVQTAAQVAAAVASNAQGITLGLGNFTGLTQFRMIFANGMAVSFDAEL